MSDRTLQQLQGYWSQKLDSENPLPKKEREHPFVYRSTKLIEDSFVTTPACMDVSAGLSFVKWKKISDPKSKEVPTYVEDDSGRIPLKDIPSSWILLRKEDLK